jgi:hypothetical protein
MTLLRKYVFAFLILAFAATAFSSRCLFENEHLALSLKENQLRWQTARPDIRLLKSGDLIFRHGRGFTSNALMAFGQREKKYSHAGIISIEDGKAYVFHAIGGEENISNKLRKDPLQIFCNPADIHAFGIYRTDLNSAQINSVLSTASEYYKQGLEFDTKFDLQSDNKMYCTEFVYKVFCRSLGDQNYISLSAFSGKQYIACDDLYCNRHCKPIYAYQY